MLLQSFISMLLVNYKAMLYDLFNLFIHTTPINYHLKKKTHDYNIWHNL